MTQLVLPLPLPPEPSDPEPPKPALTFQWERLPSIARELQPLFERHWSEIALDRELVPLEPNWDDYFELDRRGVLHVLTARNHRGALVGYCFNLVGPHLHYVSTRFAHTEMFWLAKRYRKGWRPVRMMATNLAGLKELGAKVATINFKLGFKSGRVGKLLSRLGYRPADIVMRKVL